MIVFWRLFLAYYLADFVVNHHRFYWFHERNHLLSMLGHATLFYGICAALTWPYLPMEWEFLGLFAVPGWACIGAFTLFHLFTDKWFKLNSGWKFHYTGTFVLHDLANVLFILLCAPLKAIYETGFWAGEPLTLFFVGLVFVTKVQGTFAYLLEKDLYGRSYPTLDERWIMMTTRAIFFLIMLLPGWRWILLLAAWWGACLYARKTRIMDVSNLSFFFGLPLAVVVGFLIRLRMYMDLK